MRLRLKTKFFAPILSIILIGMALLVVFNYRNTKAAFDTALGDSMGLLCQSMVHDITGDVAANLNTMRVYAENGAVAEALSGGDPAKANAALAVMVKSMHDADYSSVFTPRGDAVASSNPAAIGKVNIADRDYFKAAAKGGKDVLSKALISRTSNKAAIILAQPILNAGKEVVGVMNVAMDLEALTKSLTESKIGSSGYAFILDRDGMVLAHPQRDLLMKTDLGQTELGRKAMDVKSDQVVRYGDGEIAAVGYDATTDWRFAVVAPSKDMAVYLSRATNADLAIVGVITLAIIGVIAYIVSTLILKPINACVGFASSVADGNLDGDLSVRSGDELNDLAEALRNMAQGIRANIGEIERRGAEAEQHARKAMDALAEAEKAGQEAEVAQRRGMTLAADGLKGIVDGLTEISGNLAREIGEITQGIVDQEARTTETATAMEEMNATVLEVAKNAGLAAEATESARKKAIEGEGIVVRSMEAIDVVDGLSRGLKTGMDQLGHQAQSIGTIMEVISDIADQTNLLALNAAIEAARAGDAGRGFAVVADEVRKLAEKTMTATRQVGEAIKAIQEGTRMNIAKVDESAVAVSKANELASGSASVLREIVATVETSSSQAMSIATAAEQQSAASEQINRAEVEVSRITQRITKSMQESSQVVDTLAESIRELDRIVATFREA
jgi:methyl-accepting chemotaxis protein